MIKSAKKNNLNKYCVVYKKFILLQPKILS